MNAVKSVRNSIANAFVIGILVLTSMVVMTNVCVVETNNVGILPIGNGFPVVGTPSFGEDIAPSGTRMLNEDGDNYADLHRDVDGDPLIQIDGAPYPTNTIYIGEPNVQLDIPVRSLKEENASDYWGDDILYNVTVEIFETNTTCWDSSACSWVSAKDYITWDTSTISPDYKEDSANGGNALLIDGAGSKEIPWFYNDYGDPGFLDANNDMYADVDEFYQIEDDFKMYDGFVFDVSGDAPDGIYNISVNITYKYQTHQNVSEQRLSGGGVGPTPWYDPDNAIPGIGGTGDLGTFNYYFWEPYYIPIPAASVNFNDYLNIGFQKRADYAEKPALPAGAYWEAIPDLGYDNDDPDGYTTQAGAWDVWSNYNRDGISSWNDGDTGANLTLATANWNLWEYNDYTTAGAGNSYWQRTVDQYPYDVYEGNGTWEYSGYEGDTVWTEFKTETEYIEIRIEHGITTSEPWGDGCELIPDPSDPYYLKAGDEFKNMYMRINNRDGIRPMTDVYVNITSDDPEYFSFKHDWAWKDQINSGGFENFYYRMDALNGTPVNRYSGTIELTYTREHVRVTEELPIDFILYFTPDLRNHGGLPMTELEISKVIHTGQDETTVDFSITNNGNTLLENGVLSMDFSEFKHSGAEYTDPEGGEGTYTQRIEIPYMNHTSDSNVYDLSVSVEIPTQWEITPGTYKLMMDYEGYYFNDGVLGEPTNYVKVWMRWYDDDSDEDTDMNAYCIIDTNGDENMDIFAGDETRAIEGIHMYVEVEEFVPQTPELKISEVSINGGTDTFEQGSITDGQLTLTLTNTGERDITDLVLELDLEGYFTGSQYYDGVTHMVVNPVTEISALDIDDTAQAILDIEGIDKLLPPGIHRLKLMYQYNYDNGSTPAVTSTDTGELYFNITVTDTAPDIIPTVSTQTGTLRVGSRLYDINLYVNLANKEYYNINDVMATLTVGDNTPFIPDSNETLSGTSTVESKWSNPANDFIAANGQNTNNMYFNLNMHPDATEGTYFLDLSLDVYNPQTMANSVIPSTLEVKIYPKVAKLRITDMQISTGKVAPGKEFTMQLTIQNDGGEAAREVYIEFAETYISGDAIIETYEDVNPTGAKYPFSSEIMKAYIEEIAAYSTGSATYTVIGDLNIYPGVTYFQNIELDYKDSMGGDHATIDIVSIKSDSSGKANVDGDKYVWDTDREAWISEAELAAEEVTDYMPWMISMVVIIWLVTLLIIFMFIIRPKYKKEKMKMDSEEADDSESELPHEHEPTIEGAIKKSQKSSKNVSGEIPRNEDDGEVFDYRSEAAPNDFVDSDQYHAPAQPTPALDPPTVAEPTSSMKLFPDDNDPTPATNAYDTPVLPPAPKTDEPPKAAAVVAETGHKTDSEETENISDNDTDTEPPTAAPAAPVNNSDEKENGMPKKGPKKKY